VVAGVQSIQKLGVALHDINNVVAEMLASATLAKNETMVAIDESRNLTSQRDQLDAKTNLLRVFMDSYMLFEADIETLLSPAVGIDERFFTVLARVQKIHADCHILLASRNTKLGYTKLYVISILPKDMMHRIRLTNEQ